MPLLISHPLHRSAPLYPGTPPVSISEVKSITKSDSSNTSLITFSSHSGTHIDLPRHFCPNGSSVTDILSPETLYAPVFCIDLPIKGDQPITPDDLKEPLSKIDGIKNAAALLIRTGAFRLLATSPDLYASVHPWAHPALPAYLRELCPQLQVFGLDTISIATPLHREEGRAAHRAFLCGEHPILLLEDLDLSSEKLLNGAFTLRLYPIVYDDLDGVPVIAVAEIKI
ncbi:cyclase family protein [Methanocalculus sp.]|uniref:cyclase family protein n=1 Tax=Methanocalculus sp. TaxID=2004547 RepID=UPI002623B8E3|nr:cyclase family protein [Methanocalculus sp.]MDG6251766.1 cyclase family protein [Methanocalculus sp.]